MGTVRRRATGARCRCRRGAAVAAVVVALVSDEVTVDEQEATAQAIAKMVARLIQAAKDSHAHGVGRHLAAGCRHCRAVIDAREFLKALAGPPEPTPPGEQIIEFEERAA